jgi:hypothetical protein
MSSTSVAIFCRDVERHLIAARDPELAPSAKAAIGDRIAAIPKWSVQVAVARIVRRAWPGFKRT